MQDAPPPPVASTGEDGQGKEKPSWAAGEPGGTALPHPVSPMLLAHVLAPPGPLRSFQVGVSAGRHDPPRLSESLRV